MLEPASCRFVKPIRRGGSKYSWAGAGLEHETWVWPEKDFQIHTHGSTKSKLIGFARQALFEYWQPARVR
jgi:hypothetical protein